MIEQIFYIVYVGARKILTASVTSNMNKSVTFVLLFISPFGLLVASFSLNAANKWKNEVPDEPAVRIGRSLALNDFEAGTFGSWVDVSAADAKWNNEELATLSILHNPLQHLYRAINTFA